MSFVCLRYERCCESHSQSRPLHRSQSLLCAWGTIEATVHWQVIIIEIKYITETPNLRRDLYIMTYERQKIVFCRIAGLNQHNRHICVWLGLYHYHHVNVCCRATRVSWMEETTFAPPHGRACPWCFSWWVICSRVDAHRNTDWNNTNHPQEPNTVFVVETKICINVQVWKTCGV